MREIKFRAWDEILQKVVEGGYIEEYIQPDGMSVYHTGLSYGLLFVGRYDSKGDWIELPLMQFTGLLDKKGKEIFEGDVIRLQVNQHIWFYQIGCVVAGGANLYAINIRDNVTIDDETDRYTFQMTNVRAGLSRPIPAGCEVVGNIYEHPELLK